MLSTEDALELVITEAVSLAKNAGSESIALSEELLGRVVAQDLYSEIDVPGFPNSAMDGYVFHFEDIHHAPIPIAGEVAAGQNPEPLPAGKCLRIFTGAPIPERGDIVVPQENCTVRDGAVQINTSALKVGQHIRAKDLIFSREAEICRKGTQCDAELLSVLASAGFAKIPVYRKLRVALCITGDELVTPGQPLKYGQIYDSNQVFLSAASRALSCELVALCHLSDDYEVTKNKMLELSGQADVLICSGGASVGDKDYVQKLMQEEADVRIHKVAIKPGKPFTFGDLQGCPTFCLPGNPLSVYICFQYFVLPFIKILQNTGIYRHPTFAVASPRDFDPYPRTQFLFAHYDDGSVSLCAQQSSAALQNLLRGTKTLGALIVPANCQISHGQNLSFLPFAQ